jgi:hypothetical protein
VWRNIENFGMRGAGKQTRHNEYQTGFFHVREPLLDSWN